MSAGPSLPSPPPAPGAAARPRLSRLWQPGRLLFWQMVVFNILSSVCGWALRALPLNTTGLLLVGTLGLLNVGFGLLAMWKLMTEEPPR